MWKFLKTSLLFICIAVAALSEAAIPMEIQALEFQQSRRLEFKSVPTAAKQPLPEGSGDAAGFKGQDADEDESQRLNLHRYTSSPVTTFMVSEELSLCKEASLETVYAQFIAKGGTVITLDESAEPFRLLPGDVVFPSCSGGNNRSQTLWSILRPFADNITLMPPHATRYGFDPYNGQATWFCCDPGYGEQKEDDFPEWAGYPKSTKFGWTLFNRWLFVKEATPEELELMRDYYSTHYYNPGLPKDVRRVYITFAQNGHIHLYRLGETNSSLENVVLLVFPVADLIHTPPAEWQAHSRSCKAYDGLSEIIKARLDFKAISIE